MQFFEKLASISRKNQSLLCVGLDPDPGLLPQGLSVVEFNRAIIEATTDLVCAYKPNIAFYEALGEAGLETLLRTRDFIPPDVPVIIDAKRGDIGNTARAYAKTLFDLYGFDAATVNPYLGFDSIEPFLKYGNKGVFILCRTSNTGAGDFQSLRCETPGGFKLLYEIVADKAHEWNVLRNIGLVVGATYPEELKNIREQHPQMPLLIPGIGAQGGDLYLTVKNALDPDGGGFIINSSRQILYASRDRDFSEAARKAALRLRDEINHYRAEMKSSTNLRKNDGA
ncbi:MAG: orotidine-5'-phosphate decarboxylase [Dehalococcoidales bacterium]|jgi:orotidine-5'-phosphate decarboxylase|nr:orotidine-5'-phosphate decarboxylase [Dehalococcoidales bacterium]